MQTLDDIEAIPKSMLAVMDVREYLGCDANTFRIQAREDKKNRTDSFGFPVMVIGNRIKIPKEPFIKFMRGEK
jgi:hypothetical protein